MSSFKKFSISIFAIICVFSFYKTADASTIVSASITEDTTWDSSGSPYVIDGSFGGFGVESGATLTIFPGTVVKMGYGVEFAVFGTLNLLGESGSEITVTSFADDIIEDSNGDGNNSVPYEGDWFGLSLYDGGVVNINNANLKFSTFGAYADSGSNVSISSTNITNTFIPIERHIGSSFSENNNFYTSNIQNGHFLFGTTEGISGNLYFNSTLPYVLFDSFIETENFNAGFSPGVILKFYDSSVGASFTDSSINGTELQPIVFTSYHDDSVGGDTDAENGVPEVYYTWGDLGFFGSLNMSNTIVRYEYFGLDLNDVVGNISNSAISNSLSCMDIFGASSVTFSNFECMGANVDSISLWDTSSLNIDHVEITDSGSGISLFDNSNIFGSYLSVSNDEGFSNVLGLYDDSNATLSNLSAIGDGFGAIDISNNSSLTLSNSVIRNYFQIGFFDTTGNISITSTNMRNIDQGIYIDTVGSLSVNDSTLLVSGGSSALDNSWSNIPVNFENVWWGSVSGPQHATQNPDGTGGQIYGNNVDFTPWLLSDPYPEGMTIESLGQYKRDGLMTVVPGARNVSDAMVFKGTLYNYNGGEARMEVEVKENTISFDGTNTFISEPVFSGEEVSILKENLSDGFYHFRARVVSEEFGVSDWIEFSGENGYDFEIKQVPHYTQISSLVLTYGGWSGNLYAPSHQPKKCNVYNNPELFTIGSCGCALTSAVMLLRYYGITTGIDGLDVNPENLNNWMDANGGYQKGGDFYWPKLFQYSGNHLKYIPASMDWGPNQNLLNDQLNQGKPAILNVKGFTNPKGHFIVATNKLQDSYEVRDPSWYLTKTLNDIDPDNLPNNFITPRDYNNTFAGIRAFNYFENASLATADNILNFNLGSPADFIVTNDLGQRVGKDPVSGVEYNEIPNAYYGEEIYESEGTAFLPEMSTNKILYIIDPTVGEYDIDVIGTGTGEYTLSNFADLSTGESEEVVSSSTFSGGITSYTSNFSNDGEPEISIVSAPDTQSPKADISIDPTSWTSVIDGLDTSGEPAITQQGNNYTLTDIAGNTTLFTLTPNISTNTQKKYTFSNFIQNGQNISIPITRVEYTRQLGQQNSLKKLTQKIIIKDVVTVEAVYNSSVDKTVITKTYPNPIINPVTTEVFDGVKIIHLTAVNGEVDYEY